MNVLFDHQIFFAQRYGGISRYFAELIARLRERPSVTVHLPLTHSENEEAVLLEGITGALDRRPPIMERLKIPGRGTLSSLIRVLVPALDVQVRHQRETKALLSGGTMSVFHPTYYDGYYFDSKGRVPVVVTVFDMIHELYPQYFRHSDDALLLQKKKTAIERADHLIAISQSTKNDLCRLYGVPPEKVSVTHLANPLRKCDASDQLPPVPGEYLLFVGERKGYKNFQFMVSALIPLFNTRPGLSLICTGARLSEEERLLLESHHLTGRVLHCHVATMTLLQLYRHAAAFVFPSLYEGFGLPVLEAMGAGCPAIVSRTSSFPEVAGDAAVYIDPTDAESIRNGVQGVLESPALRSELKEKGIARAAKFSWEATAEQTETIYRTLL
ncbi:MAG: glycosyltransferase family 1 protein [Ignavibacteriales bacterium]|nr:glycosyltransferase family 1 protein [Ignavibacteriales bacterium]